MKGFLLDTHTFLWAVSAPSKLGKKCRLTLEKNASVLYLSIGSIWEISIKRSLRKLQFDGSTETLLNQGQNDLGLSILSIDTRHILSVEQLPLQHRDPFDRLLVAQCLIEDLSILSGDEQFDEYGIRRVWS